MQNQPLSNWVGGGAGAGGSAVARRTQLVNQLMDQYRSLHGHSFGLGGAPSYRDSINRGPSMFTSVTQDGNVNPRSVAALGPGGYGFGDTAADASQGYQPVASPGVNRVAPPKPVPAPAPVGAPSLVSAATGAIPLGNGTAWDPVANTVISMGNGPQTPAGLAAAAAASGGFQWTPGTGTSGGKNIAS